MPVRPRPLSPHLEIYRWQISSTLSILHRATRRRARRRPGGARATGWCRSPADDPLSYAHAARFFASAPGLLLLAGWSFAFFYHLLNGVRHLFWDIGWDSANPSVM